MIWIGALCSLAMAPWRASYSLSLERRPVRSFQESTPDSAASIRSTSCWSLISSEKIPTEAPCCRAALRAISRARVVFPIDGRAARMIRSDFWNPDSTLSSPVKPEGTPRFISGLALRCSNRSQASLSDVPIGRNFCELGACVAWKIFFSAWSSASSTLSGSENPISAMSSAAWMRLRSVDLLSTCSA